MDGGTEVCDVMHAPGKLYKEGTAQAKQYLRLLKENDKDGATYGGVGGASIELHPHMNEVANVCAVVALTFFSRSCLP